MAFEPTAAQKAAIELDHCNLLVSAAAGSGKTATLIERIMRRITDPVNPCSVTDLLVVTFTKDSASDLVSKLSEKLSARLAEEPNNRHLAAQLLKVRSADVSTIHSFCMRVLKPNFQALGLPSDFRVGDEGEIRMLRQQQMRRTLEDFYEADPDTLDFSFAAVADCLSQIKNEDAFSDVLLRLYDEMLAYPDGVEHILRQSDALEEADFLRTAHGQVLARTVRRFAAYYRRVFSDAADYFAGHEPFDRKYRPAFLDDLRCLATLEASEDYASLAEAINNVKFTSLGTVAAAEKTDRSDFFVAQRNKYKDFIKKLQKDYTAATPAAIRSAARRMAELNLGIYRILSAFDRDFGSWKRSMGVCDYSDLERYTYRLLVGADGKPTPLAREVGARYREIYVDEYQDTNELQDAIFCAIGNGHNRFMVGDIKQSIYRFRGADSAVFAAYRARFPNYEEGMDPTRYPGLCVFMSDNFRCDRSVIDFSNAISRFLFGSTGGVPFEAADELKFSKVGGTDQLPVDVCLFEKREDEDEDAECAEEARFISAEIRRMMDEEKKPDGTPYRPRDFAVLCRSPKHLAPELIRLLGEEGIPVRSEESEPFFEQPEILLVLCLLNAIDNPLRDTYLAGALCSPIFGFSMDELIRIRRAASGAYSLYDALCACEGELEGKVQAFLSRLARYRELARGESSERLIRYLYEDTGLLPDAGRTERRNLLRLYHYARVFESSSYKGLYRFLEYVDSIRDQEVQSASSEGADSVTVTTIHKSKGMEFTVCFLSDTARAFNETVVREPVVYDPELGLTAKLLGAEGVARVNTVHRMCAIRSTLDAERLENMRVLYVAMTRARAKLIVTATSDKPAELLDACRAETGYANEHWFFDRPGSFIRWILGGIFREDAPATRVLLGNGEGRITAVAYTAADAVAPSAAPAEAGAAPAPEGAGGSAPEAEPEGAPRLPEELIHRLQARFRYRYPHAHLEKLPAKLTVSKLSPTTLDEWAEKDAHIPTEEEKIGLEACIDREESLNAYEDILTPPAFLAGKREATGAEAGTATHVFMQFCDLKRLKEKGPRAELDRLLRERFLPEEMAPLVRLSHISAFLRSRLYREMENAATLRREFRFNLLLPAEAFTSDGERKAHLAGEQILVQGVIDCLLFRPDGSYDLIDYKTDYLTDEERRDPAKAAEKLRSRHKNQLTYYAQACQKMIGHPPARILIYSLPLGDTVEM